MKKNILFFVFLLTASCPVMAIFDTSPWLIIENKSNFNFEYTMQITTPSINEDEFKIICPPSIDTLRFDIIEIEKSDAGNSVILQLNFVCKAKTLIIIPSIFYTNTVYFNPTIKSMQITQNSLQLTDDIVVTDQNCRYVTIDFDEEVGFSTQAQPISLHIKLIHNAKESIRTCLAYALEKVQQLPY